MARLVSCGFELNSLALEAAIGTSVNWTVSSTTKRTGSYSARCAVTDAILQFTLNNAASNTAAFFGRAYLDFEVLPTSEGLLLRLGQAYVRVASGGTSLTLTDASANVLLGPYTVNFATGTQYRIEVEVSTVAAGGSQTGGLYLDGVQLGRSTALTFGGATTPTLFEVRNPPGATTYCDDVGANNDSGAAPHNTLPGAGSIIYLRPNADGDADTGTPTRGGADSGAIWSQMDEVTPNDATDYVVLPVNPSDAIVAIDDATSLIGASDTIRFVEVHGRVAGATATACNWFPQIMSQAAGARVSATAVGLATASWFTNDDTSNLQQAPLRQLTDPQAGGAWTLALLNSTQIAARTTDGTPDTWVSALWALVEFVPAISPLPQTMRNINQSVMRSVVR